MKLRPNKPVKAGGCSSLSLPLLEFFFSFPLLTLACSRGSCAHWGLLSMILWSLPYNIKCPEWTAVANWCDINKIKTKSLFNFCPGKRSGFFFFPLVVQCKYSILLIYQCVSIKILI